MKNRLCIFVTSVPLCALLVCIGAVAQGEPLILSLDDAIKLALEYNLDLKSSQDRVTSSNISVESARSDFKINIRPNISGLYQQNDELDQTYGLTFSKKFRYGGEASWQTRTRISNSLDDEYQTDIIFAYTQPLLKGRGSLSTTNTLLSAKQNARVQYRALQLAQQRLIVQVVTSYDGILRDQILIDVNMQAVERSKLLLQAAEAKLKVGMASKMDVFRAELQQLTAENNLVHARASLENAKRQFNLLLGTDMNAEYRFSSNLKYFPISIDQDTFIRQALANRLEIQTAREQIHEAERQVKLARQNLYPPLDVSVRYTLRGQGDDLDKSWEMDDDFWGVGISSSFNLDLASERAAYQQAELSLNAAIRSLQALKEDIISEVLQTIVSVKQAEASVALQKQSVRQAEKQLELSSLRYKKGLSDNLDVVNAQESLVQTKSSYYSSIVQHIISKTRLEQVTGTLEVPF
ncbi:hypothetical protein CSA56_12890 [candidate division KSB3 bacterium]|uniref:Transporter n=1 Tax=candidate division KSB3 bacterium TaxID=2044937 RepID=A0A2G6KE22_9BACT|nr:MAG: hypothetical protein CSA56_12890 [candidate division KSB3 bacterium]